ncbi:MAG: hypothetical protein LUQ03_06075 [Methanomicrobiales archaeon]|nr:hypothetical protein [Methanomicrobiales archaeon]
MTKESTEKSVQQTSRNFAAELRSFFVLCILNLVFGAMIMAFGIAFIVTGVLGIVDGESLGFAAVQVIAWGAIAFLGFRWILSSVTVMEGVTEIRDEFAALEEPVSGEALTGLIVRMMAHYREHRQPVRQMTIICTLGGIVFIGLGVINIFEGIMALNAPPVTGLFYLPAFLAPLLAVGIDLAVGVVSLLISSWFRKYSRAWDLRLAEASRSEDALRQTMEQG